MLLNPSLRCFATQHLQQYSRFEHSRCTLSSVLQVHRQESASLARCRQLLRPAGLQTAQAMPQHTTSNSDSKTDSIIAADLIPLVPIYLNC